MSKFFDFSDYQICLAVYWHNYFFTASKIKFY